MKNLAHISQTNRFNEVRCVILLFGGTITLFGFFASKPWLAWGLFLAFFILFLIESFFLMMVDLEKNNYADNVIHRSKWRGWGLSLLGSILSFVISVTSYMFIFDMQNG